MKRFTLVALALFTSFVFTNALFAQGAYAPLIQKETVSVVRVNLDNVDSTKISSTIQTVGSAAVDYFVADSETATNAKQTIPLVGIIAAQFFGTNVQPIKDAGVGEFFFVVDQPEDASKTLYPYVAFPVSGLSDAQKKDLRSAIGEINKQIPEESEFTLKYRFEREGFLFVLIVPSSVSTDEVKAYMKERFTKIASVDKEEFVNGFKAIDSGAFVSGVTLNAQNEELTKSQLEKVFSQFEENPALAEYADTLKETSLRFNEISKSLMEKVQYNYWYVSLDNLEIVSNIQANSADDAKAYVDAVKDVLLPELNKTLDAVLESTLTSAEDKVADDEKELAQKCMEKVKTLVDVFVQYSIEDSVVSWKMNEKFWVDNKPVFDEIVQFVQEEILPKFTSDEDEDEENLDDDFEAL